MDEAQRAMAALFNPFSGAHTDPYPWYVPLRESGAVLPTPFGSMMIARYELVDRVLRSSAFRTPRGYRDANDPAGRRGSRPTVR